MDACVVAVSYKYVCEAEEIEKYQGDFEGFSKRYLRIFLGMPVWIASLWAMWEIRSYMLAWKERERLEFWENEDMNAAEMDGEGEVVSDWKYREAYDIPEKKSIRSWFVASLVIHIAVMIWMKLPV